MASASQSMETLHPEGSEQLDPEVLRRLYSYMLKCRLVEERIRVLYRQGRFAGNYFAAVGQEVATSPPEPVPPQEPVAAEAIKLRDRSCDLEARSFFL